MYIDPFICGVLATILAQIVSIIVFSIHANIKNKKGR